MTKIAPPGQLCRYSTLPSEKGWSKRLLVAGFMAATAATAFSQTLTPLIKNGNFEDYSIAAHTPSGDTPRSEYASPTNLAGWTYEGLVPDALGNLMVPGQMAVPYGYPDYPLEPGADLDHTGQYFLMDAGEEYGVISQMISDLVPGQTYQLTFNQCLLILVGDGDAGIPMTGQWKVSLGDETHMSGEMTTDRTHSYDWNTQTMTFTATSATEKLSFASIGTGGPPQLGLDTVSLVAVPEPSSMMLLSIVGVLPLFRRKRKS
ncbi:MAG: DUF642 domain-containing protein [Luteolibacter sp.]